jgi:methylisocitrate lyase
MSKTTMLRKMLEEPGIIVMPCSFDSLSAKLIEKAGFKVVGITGAGICATMLGMPGAEPNQEYRERNKPSGRL